ncbi:MAG: hypothetical protein ACK55I_38700, partial [bacterium]
PRSCPTPSSRPLHPPNPMGSRFWTPSFLPVGDGGMGDEGASFGRSRYRFTKKFSCYGNAAERGG